MALAADNQYFHDAVADRIVRTAFPVTQPDKPLNRQTFVSQAATHTPISTTLHVEAGRPRRIHPPHRAHLSRKHQAIRRIFCIWWNSSPLVAPAFSQPNLCIVDDNLLRVHVLSAPVDDNRCRSLALRFPGGTQCP